MPSFDYIVPLLSVAEDNDSYINKASILFKDAAGFSNPNEGCLGWNFNHCPNDDDYCQPYISGDKIYLQYRPDIKNYFHVTPYFINTATGEEFDASDALTFQTGYDSSRNYYANLVIDTGNALFANVTCWYVRIRLYKCDLADDEPFADCLEAKQGQGMTLAEAIDSCYEDLCDEYDDINSEPYCIIRCEQPSLLVGGSYTAYDCNGNYYGLINGAANIFKQQTRIVGSIESQGFTISETSNRLKKVKSQQAEKFLLRSSRKLPYYVIQQIAASFNSQQLTIDEVNYSGATKIDKNFDEGEMWILNEFVFRNCEEINFTCS